MPVMSGSGDELNEITLKEPRAANVFVRQLRNPFLVVFAAATAVSFILGERTNAIIISILMVVSVLLGFWNEYSAERTVKDLLKKISFMAVVIRDGQKQEVPVRSLTVGETIFLFPGAIVPADAILDECLDLEVDESALSGESATVSKKNGEGCFMGTKIIRGTAQAKITAIGKKTRLGKISVGLATGRPPTGFQKGLEGFSLFLVRVVTIMVLVIIIVNVLLGRPFFQSVLFSLAVAIGLTPELLPVVITVSLSRGAGRLAKKEVIVKQLVAIEDLGNIDILCTDKTGTLTEGKISLTSHIDINGERNDRVLELALFCSGAVSHHRIFGDPIDTSIAVFAREKGFKVSEKIRKIFDEPFNFERRAMFSVVEENGKRQLIYKGAPPTVLEFCRLTPQKRSVLIRRIKELNTSGLRVIAVATKSVEEKASYSFADAKSLNLVGFITLADSPKHTAREAIERLAKIGTQVKIITGDNEIVTRRVSEEIGFPCGEILVGPEIEEMGDSQLASVLEKTSVFARTTPEQKLRIIRLLKSSGHTVGFLGDGINDALALQTADVGISVNTAVDVAKDAASVVLLRKSLSVIADGVTEGRKIFANTRKYILMETSSNFGNMFSAAGASFLLPFLPMTPSQILLANSLYDVSQLSISSDSVDSEELIRPVKWDINLIRKYMLIFGPLSSIYDFLTFGVLLFIFRAGGSLFQTGWFVESLLTQVLVVFIIRTRKFPFLESRPSLPMTLTCLGVTLTALVVPFTPLSRLFSFVPLPFTLFGIILLLTFTYLVLIQIGKTYIDAKVQY